MARHHPPHSTGPLKAYLSRHGLHPPRKGTPPESGVGLIVALPCHDEPDLLTTLEDLWRCDLPPEGVEVLVGINHSADASHDVKARNTRTALTTRTWFAEHNTPGLHGHILEFRDLPPRKAGVGLARKLVMDEAVSRFATLERPDGVILCLDADCRVPANYLLAVSRHFGMNPTAPATILPYAHDLDHLTDMRLREGIIAYELHLRCLVLGLRLAGHPHPYHTIGSAVAVRASAYARQGGMNQRKAGEDFHFLNKFFSLPGFAKLFGTTVWPGVRPSHRVPFGTGRALSGWLEGEERHALTYPINSYHSLAPLMEAPESLFDSPGSAINQWLGRLSAELRAWLDAEGFEEKIAEIRNNTAHQDTFRQRYFQWLNRFRVMKAQNFLRERGLEDRPSIEVAGELLRWAGENRPGEPELLLLTMRGLEQGEDTPPPQP